ncbi:His-Xaa-Ser system protein HxsD [Microvirga sp. KLBC 81]|uniref:His-Xaa-Ser system protein HxsD n=1 Tax=Microvirga sp. KLBC 81 TaxID=1862707 RepID=UPI000D51D0DA|nr:His-Xaa-Ser system protein HxsD [Microvirga sp. KLBC 81]
MPLPISEPVTETHVIEVDPNVHPREAVLRACYWLSHEAEIDIVTIDEGRIRLTLKSRDGQSESDLAWRLRSALIDFSIRVDIERETSDLRSRIWQTAFSEAMGTKPR